jgi:CspA family cold shock protein
MEPVRNDCESGGRYVAQATGVPCWRAELFTNSGGRSVHGAALLSLSLTSICSLANVILLDPLSPSPASVRRCDTDLAGLPHAAGSTSQGDITMANGTVKWFNTSKGFGFIAPDGGRKDVFVHISAVERAGLTGLADNQAVTFDVVSGRDGREAAENLQLA